MKHSDSADNSKSKTWTAAFQEAQKLDADKAADLEKKLEVDPTDLLTRFKLLLYYTKTAIVQPELREIKKRHVLWIVQNQPGYGNSMLHGYMKFVRTDVEYEEIKSLWLKKIEANPTDLDILFNAARFLSLEDTDLATEILTKGKKIDPNNPKWAIQLGHLYSLKNIFFQTIGTKLHNSQNSLKEFEDAASADPKKRFYVLVHLAQASFDSGEMGKAKNYSEELLNTAKGNKRDWNYGNAIFHGNMVLGRIALSSGDIEAAKRYLLLAGKTPGSPQLNTFGPNMTLAKELLQKGEKDAVIDFFRQCSKFWEMGNKQLDDWTVLVQDDRVPDFRMNLNY